MRKTSVKFLRTYIYIYIYIYIATHGIPESIRTDQFSGFKGKTMKKFCTEHNIEQKFSPVGDHRGCGLVERTIQTIKRRLGMFLDEKCFLNKTCTEHNISRSKVEQTKNGSMFAIRSAFRTSLEN